MRPGTIRIVLSYAQLQWLAAAKIQCDTSLLPMNEKDAQLLDTFEALLPYFNQVLSGQTVRYEQETNSQGVGPRWTSVTYSPTLDANGVTDGWVAVVVDISEPR